LVKLIPNTRMENPPAYPMITKIHNGGYYLNYGINSFNTITEINTESGYQFFKAQLWNNGELVW